MHTVIFRIEVDDIEGINAAVQGMKHVPPFMKKNLEPEGLG